MQKIPKSAMYSQDTTGSRSKVRHYKNEAYAKKDNDDVSTLRKNSKPGTRSDESLAPTCSNDTKNDRSDEKYRHYENYFTQSRTEPEVSRKNFKRVAHKNEPKYHHSREQDYKLAQAQMHSHDTRSDQRVDTKHQHEYRSRVPDYQREYNHRAPNYEHHRHVPDYQREHHRHVPDYQREHHHHVPNYVQPKTRFHDIKNPGPINPKSREFVRHSETDYQQTHSNNAVDQREHRGRHGDENLVIVTHVMLPALFYVRYAKDNYTFSNITQQLIRTHHLSKKVESVSEGFMVAVFKDSKYYRGIIKNIRETTCEIELIDRGDKIESPKTACYTVPRELVTIPRLTFLCNLTGVVDSSCKNWTVADFKAIKNMLHGPSNNYPELFRMKIVNDDKTRLDVELYFQNRIRVTDVFKIILFGTDVVVPETRRNFFSKMVKFKPNKKYNVKILHVTNPGNLYVQKYDDGGKQCNERSEHMNYHFKNSIGRKVYAPYVGLPIAFKESNQKWHRAKILHVGQGKLYEKKFVVLLVDLGEEKHVEWQSIYILPVSYLQYPPEAIKCRLVGISPIEDDWSYESTDVLIDFINTKEVLSLETENNCDDVQNVVLFRGDICINSFLVENRLVIKNIADSSLAAKYMDHVAQQIDRNYLEEEVIEKYENIEGKIMVNILQCKSPDDIRVIYSTAYENYNEYRKSMRTFYNTENRMPVEEDYDQETLYAVKIGHEWYKGKFVMHVSKREALVLLMDLHKKKIVYKEDIFHLDPQFETTNYFIHKCHLDGIVPSDTLESWPICVCDILRDELKKYTKIYIELKGDVINDSQPIELWAPKRKFTADPSCKMFQWISFNKFLKQHGLAISSQKKYKTAVSFVNYNDDADEMKVDDLRIANTEPENVTELGNDESDADQKATDKKQTRSDFGSPLISSSVAIFKERVFNEDFKRNLILTNEWQHPIELKQQILAKITYVNSDCDLYVQKVDDIRDLEKINNILQKRYCNSITSDDTRYFVRQPCIAKFPMDQKWYRARVLKVDLSMSQAKVQFVDYGNDETVSFKDMRADLITTETPIFCHRIKTSKIAPINGSWSVEQLMEIHETIVDKEFIIVLKKDMEYSDYYQAEVVMNLAGTFELFKFIVKDKKFARYQHIDHRERDKVNDDHVQLDKARQIDDDDDGDMKLNDDDQSNDDTDRVNVSSKLYSTPPSVVLPSSATFSEANSIDNNRDNYIEQNSNASGTYYSPVLKENRIDKKNIRIREQMFSTAPSPIVPDSNNDGSDDEVYFDAYEQLND